MRRYQYHSAGTDSSITLTYNNGLLISAEMEPYVANENTNAQAHFLISEQAFLTRCKAHNVTVTEISVEISFDQFWERYEYKVDKQLAIDAWNKMSAQDRAEAYAFIPRYNSQLKMSGLAKKYPVRYLKHKSWIQ